MVQPIDLENSKYSYGTTPMYNALIDEIIRRDSPAEIVMFNVATIIRNCAQTERITEMVKEEKLFVILEKQLIIFPIYLN